MHALNEKNRIGIASLGVVDQVKASFVKRNRLAMSCGAILGGFVPVGTFVIAHQEAPQNGIMWLMVAGGLFYSVLSVYQWSRVAFKSQLKSIGFCILLESIMTFSQTDWLAYTALGLLVAINAVSAGCQLVLDQKESRKRR